MHPHTTEEKNMAKPFRYFSYSHDTGFDTYETAEEAKKAAEESLQGYRDTAHGDEWDEEVTGVCWGEIKQEIVELTTGETINDCGDYAAEYELRDVGAETGA
jgi:hypothetical protein